MSGRRVSSSDGSEKDNSLRSILSESNAFYARKNNHERNVSFSDESEEVKSIRLSEIGFHRSFLPRSPSTYTTLEGARRPFKARTDMSPPTLLDSSLGSVIDTGNTWTRSTRFGVANAQRHVSVPTTNRQGYSADPSVNEPQLPWHLRDVPASPRSENEPQKSVTLPNLPNLTELISGVFENGTPVFYPQASSRFSSNARTYQNADNAKVANYAAEIETPVDDKRIKASIDYLQTTVALLKKDIDDAEQTIQQLQKETNTRRGEFGSRRSRLSDSAMGSTDVGSDVGEHRAADQRRMSTENFRLESSIRALQSEVDSIQTAASVDQDRLSKVIKDRDSAISQLGVAYFTNEKLTHENDALKEEVKQYASQYEALTQENERIRAENQIFRRGEGQLHRHISSLIAQRDKMAMEPKINHSLTLGEAKFDKAIQSKGERAPFPVKSNVKRAVSEEIKVAPHGRHTPLNETLSTDLTYLSSINNTKIRGLRKTIESQKTVPQDEAMSRSTSSQGESIILGTPYDESTRRFNVIAPRKPSIDQVNQGAGQSSLNQVPLEKTIQKSPPLPSIHQRHSSDNSVLARCLRRLQKTNADECLPPAGSFTERDDYLSKQVNYRRPSLPLAGSFEERDDLISKQVDCRKPSIEPGLSNKGRNIPKIVPKPVPVSERMHECAKYEEDPTIRPSQPPGLALATVLAELENELKVERIKVRRYQDMLENFDPSRSQRARDLLFSQTQKSLNALEVKAKQIYSLYDVLAGQKELGQEMTQDQTELVLRSCGIDPSDLRSNQQNDTIPTRRSLLTGEELPRDKMESTTTQKSNPPENRARNGFANFSSRRG